MNEMDIRRQYIAEQDARLERRAVLLIVGSVAGGCVVVVAIIALLGQYVQ